MFQNFTLIIAVLNTLLPFLNPEKGKKMPLAIPNIQRDVKHAKELAKKYDAYTNEMIQATDDVIDATGESICILYADCNGKEMPEHYKKAIKKYEWIISEMKKSRELLMDSKLQK